MDVSQLNGRREFDDRQHTAQHRCGYPDRMTPLGLPEVRPQTLLLTFLGKAVLGRHIAVFSGTYLAVMDRLGVSEQAVRSTLSRMVTRGLLARHRRGRK